MPARTVSEIAAICEGDIEGDGGLLITGANSLESAKETELSFVANSKALTLARSSRAGCLLVPKDFAENGTWARIRVANPRVAFVRALASLYPPPKHEAGIHPSALIASTAQISKTASIGAFVTIGEHTSVGEQCVIGAHCSIGSSVSVGDRTALRPNVTLYDGVRIGSRVLLHSGCVIGADGFGFALVQDHYEKFPQVGTVEIEDDVEIGASSCVDRAALGVTRIGEGTKLDNMVHIAHNCQIGRHVVIAAQTGFSGGVTVGDYAVIGGQVGVGDKATIESRAVVGSGAGILTSARVGAGEPVWGVPARPLRQHLKGLAYIGKIPDLQSELRETKRKLQALEAQLSTREAGDRGQ
ncbi:MAG: UDP-3-O-(3-hydroxymyristoyl)glucosamine N-acyltransferase [Bryobacteraceae bacterium]